MVGLIIVDASVETPIIGGRYRDRADWNHRTDENSSSYFCLAGLIIVDASVETPIIGEDTGTEQIGIVDQTKIVPHSLRNRGFVQRVVSWILIIRNMKKTIGFRTKKTVVFNCFFRV